MEVVFGASAPPLHEQVGVEPNVLAREQAEHDAIVRLAVAGYLSESTKERFYRRLVRRIAERLQEGWK